VHTAPGHGLDDFIVGRKYGLPVANPVGNDGRFLPDTPLFAGLKVEAATPVIIEALKERGRLAHHESYRHSYPHCWRHKSPLIFRATPQWFISMEQNQLRAHTLRDIKKVQWTPAWGEQRITGNDRKPARLVYLAPAHLGCADPAVVHKQTGALHPRTQELIEAAQRAWTKAESMPGLRSTRPSCCTRKPTTMTRSPMSWTCGRIRIVIRVCGRPAA